MNTEILHNTLKWLMKEIEEGLHDPSINAKVETLLAKGWEFTQQELIQLIEKWDGTEDSLRKEKL